MAAVEDALCMCMSISTCMHMHVCMYMCMYMNVCIYVCFVYEPVYVYFKWSTDMS